MTLPVSGPISLADVNTELGLSSTAQIDMNSSAVRTLFAVPSGAISMSDGYGKANAFAFTISSNQTNANLATLATTAGWNGTTKVIATIDSGVYISSNSTGTPALTISGSFPGGVELINNGYIIGRGGNAGNGGSAGVTLSGEDCNPYANGGGTGSAGGLALSVSVSTSITNNGTIGGGGGGGGGGGAGTYLRYCSGGGGGGGGRSSYVSNTSGGSGGTISINGACTNNAYASNGSGGNQGTVSAAGTGGGGGSVGISYGGTGGTGGTWGSSGSTGGSGRTAGGGSGGSAGGAVSGNSNITWVATGTRLGSIS